MRPAPRSLVRRLLPAALLLAVGATSVLAGEPEAPAAAARPSWARTVAAIDAAIEERLQHEGVTAAAPADDAEFLRRVTLDLTGTIPTAAEAEAFLADRAPDKRARVIDALLASPAYAEHWSHVWYRLLTGVTPNAGQRGDQDLRFLRGPADATFQAWLLERMQQNTPYNQMVEALISATGRTNANGATGWYARWEGKPNDLAGAVSRTFLGVKIACAQCHDHMYEPTWKQKDFQGMAAFFVTSAARPVPEYQQAYREVEKLREQMLAERKAAGDGMAEGADGAKPKAAGGAGLDERELRRNPALREALMNRFVMDVQDLEPRTLGVPGRARPNKDLPEAVQERLALADIRPKAWMGPTLPDLPGVSRRMLLARWVTSDDNPYFARALVNRYWGLLLGSGFVNPVDDFTSMNPPSHPGLLDLLAADLKASGYDLRHLLRVIANSATYQRSSRWTGATEPDPALFARAAVRSLTNEQLYDALLRATGTESAVERLGGGARGPGAGPGVGRGGNAVFAAFAFLFDDDEGQEADGFAGSIPQGLFLMNGRLLQGALSALPGSTLTRVLETERTDAGRVRALYLAAYGREPEAEERRQALTFVRRAAVSKDERAGWQDLFWVLLNSAEFMSNH